MTSFFTFGQNHVHSLNGITFDKDIVVEIEDNEPRALMFAFFGPKWAMEYDFKPDMDLFPRGCVKLGPDGRII